MLTNREKRWIKDSFKSKYDLVRFGGEDQGSTICGFVEDQYCILGYSGELGGVSVYSPVCPVGNAETVWVELENKTILELEEILESRYA